MVDCRSSNINIANFISLGLQEEIFGKSSGWCPIKPGNLQAVSGPFVGVLEKVLRSYPGNSIQVRGDSGQISTAVLGKPVRVCTLGNLPRIEGNVLLDIDVDFLTIRQACRSFAPPEAFPGGGPDELWNA